MNKIDKLQKYKSAGLATLKSSDRTKQSVCG